MTTNKRSEKEQERIFALKGFYLRSAASFAFFFKKANVCVCAYVCCSALEGQMSVLNITILNASTAGSVRYV